MNQTIKNFITFYFCFTFFLIDILREFFEKEIKLNVTFLTFDLKFEKYHLVSGHFILLHFLQSK